MKKTNNNVATTTVNASKEVKKSNRISNASIMETLNNIASSINDINSRVNTLESAIRVSKDNSTSPFYASKEEVEAKKGGLGLDVDVKATSEEKALVSSEVSAEKATASANASMNSEEAEKAVKKHNASLKSGSYSLIVYDNGKGIVFRSANRSTMKAVKLAIMEQGNNATYTMSKKNGSFIMANGYESWAQYSYAVSRATWEQYKKSESYKKYSSGYKYTSDKEEYANAFKATSSKEVIEL